MNRIWQKCWDVTLILADKKHFGFCPKHCLLLPPGSLALEKTSCHVERSMWQGIKVHVSECGSEFPSAELSDETAAPADNLTAALLKILRQR